MHNNFPKFYYFIDKLDIKYICSLDKNVAIIYRNYEKKPSEIEIQKFQGYCKKNNRKFLVSYHYDIAIKFNLDGLYIPAFYKKKIYILKEKKNFITIGSAHNIKEIREKEKQGVKLIFLSPLFKKKNSNGPLGLYRYNLLANHTKLPTVALGGIEKKNIKLLKMTKTSGFAGINFFKSKI